MKTENILVGKLNPAKYNPRKIDQKSFEGLKNSISKFGYVEPIIVNKRTGLTVIGGHQRLKALIDLGINEALCVILDIPEIEEKALNVALNNRHTSGEYDRSELEKILLELKDGLEEFDDLNFDDLALEFDFDLGDEPEDTGNEDIIPDEPEHVVIKLGDLIELGNHRLLCGDSIVKEDVGKLMGGEKAELLHSDPPYGMGKEKDGVLNDNLYKSKLDEFQMNWWNVFRNYLTETASVYIWGNAEDLWRLWFSGGLNNSERLTFRNEIVWNKGQGQGINSEQHRMYPTATERCIFFIRGEQGFNNNSDNYWDGWEPIREYLFNSRIEMGWDIPKMKTIAGHSDKSRDHWTGKSQWSFVTEEVYKKFQAEAKEQNKKAFQKEYEVLKKEYEVLKKEFYSTRAFFNNTHDFMTDVWSYQRVEEKERFEHATPKPVDMIKRIIKSSSSENSLIIEPFLGSGTTLIACEKTNRKCFGMELDEKYCQVIIQRWCDYTGKTEIKINGQLINWNEYANKKTQFN